MNIFVVYLRDWSRLVGSYVNNTLVICWPAQRRAALSARHRRTTNHEGVVDVTSDQPRPILIITRPNNFVWNIYAANTFRTSTKSTDIAYLPPLWRHAYLFNDKSCCCTHPVVAREQDERCQARKLCSQLKQGESFVAVKIICMESPSP